MAIDEDDETQFFSQFPSHHPTSQGSSVGGNLGRGIGFLDLNNNVDDFPELGSYQELLQDEPADHGCPSIGPGRGRSVSQGGGGHTRSVSIGGAHMCLFVAPGAAAVDGGVRGRGSAWVWLGQQTGCGRTGDGAITTSTDWWNKKIKERPDVRKFKGGNPDYLDILIELFQGVVVDGSSAYVPIDEVEEENMLLPMMDMSRVQ
ncbi:hypothetical protein D1007_22970 [Hordeum vulgare]|nr:hypothetical protein D1007_22970 [Hordeum vulgare]